jgi:hypothetical protein
MRKLVKRRKADCVEDGMIELHLSSEPSSQCYTLLPGILELRQYLILEKKLYFSEDLAFFSHGIDERNQALIPIILERAFPDSHREILRNSNFLPASKATQEGEGSQCGYRVLSKYLWSSSSFE